MKSFAAAVLAIGSLSMANAAKKVEFKIERSFTYEMGKDPNPSPVRRLHGTQQRRKNRVLRGGSKSGKNGGGKKNGKSGGGGEEDFIVITDDDQAFYSTIGGSEILQSRQGDSTETAGCNESAGSCAGSSFALVSSEEDANGCPFIDLAITAGTRDTYFYLHCPTPLYQGTLDIYGCYAYGIGECPVPASLGNGRSRDKGSSYELDIGPGSSGVGSVPQVFFVKYTCCEIPNLPTMN